MKICFVAGEASGDLLGGELLTALRTHFPDLTALGVGGPRLRAAGLVGAYDINDLSVIGLVEVVRRLPRLWQIFRHLCALLRREKPDLLLTIDLPDFNFFLARQAKRLNIPVIHYVSPQVWAWRSGRVEGIARLVDHLLLLFPFEAACYARTTLPVTFVGHPLVSITAAPRDRQAIRRSLEFPPEEPVLLLLPGSRKSEVARLLAIQLTTAHRLLERIPDLRVALALAESLRQEDLSPYWPESCRFPVAIRQGMTYDLLAAADVALVASGTATLETALLETPQVVMYRVNGLTYLLGRLLIQVPFVSLVNLVAGKAVVQERLQHEANPEQLAADLALLLRDPERVAQMKQAFRAIRQQLSPPTRGAAQVVADFLRNRSTGKALS